MSTLQLGKSRPDAEAIGAPVIFARTSGAGATSSQLANILSDLARSPSDRVEDRVSARDVSTGRQRLRRVSPIFTSGPSAASKKSIEEQLYDALSAFKVRTATIAMHLDRDWRSRLFEQLDSLLATQDWEPEDETPTLASFSTFIRMLVFLKPDRRPGLGATSDGRLIATWTVGDDRLTMECWPNDIMRWHLSTLIDGERERAAAETPISRLGAVLAPYNPQRWFNANHVSSA
jgi:hypothetical protein